MKQTGQQRALLKGRPRTQLPHGSERFTACSSEEIGPSTSRLVETPVPQRFGVGSDGQSLVWSPLKRAVAGPPIRSRRDHTWPAHRPPSRTPAEDRVRP